MEKVALNNSVFQNLLENIPGMLYRCKFEPTWSMLYVSKGSFDLTGYYPEELMTHKVDFASLIYEADRNWVWEHFTLNLSKRTECNCEYRIIGRDGKQKWVREIASGVYNNAGDLLYIEGYITDISEKKEHHQIVSSLETHVQIVNANERRLKALLKVIPDVLFRIKSNGNCCRYDHAESDLFADNNGHTIFAFYPEHIANEFLKYTTKVIKSGKGLRFEFQTTENETSLFFEARFVKSGDDEVICIVRNNSSLHKPENAINHDKEFYENLINSVNVDIAVVNKENKYELVNQSAVKEAPIREWLIGKDDFEYCNKKNIPIDIAEYRTKMYALAGELKQPIEWIEELCDEQGNKRFYVRTVKPFTTSSKPASEQLKISYGLNVTALKVIQNELLKREQLLSFSHKLAKIGYWVWYIGSERSQWSDVIYEILEINREDIIPCLETFLDFIHPADKKNVFDVVSESKKYKSSFSIEYKILTPSGQIKYIKEQSDYKQAQDGEEEYVFGIIQDITDIRLSQEALARREDHFRAIAESSPVLITEVDRNENIIYINTPETKNSDAILGSSVLSFIEDEYVNIFKEKLDSSFATGAVQRLEISVKKLGAERKWYHVNMGPVKNREGKIESVVLLSQNITENKQNDLVREKLIKEVNHRYNELMQFNYVVSHNLRAPVANILGMAYLLNNGLPEEETHTIFEYLLQSAESIDTLIKDLNNVLSARSPLNETRETFELSGIVDEVCHELEQQIKYSGALIQVQIHPDADELTSIKSYIQSIIHSLLSNAIKYKDSKRALEILIKTTKKASCTSLEISDNGIGIDLNIYKDQIFGLYKRFTKQSEGKGLGLHMAKTQIESLGGNISVESKVGEGTTFKITLSN